MKRVWLTAILLAAFPAGALACEGPVAVCDGVSADGFALIRDGKPATVYVDAQAARPVQRVAEDFAADLERVSGVRPAVVHDLKDVTGPVVVIAEAGHSPLPVDDSAVAGKWEAYQQSVVDTGHGKVLVILGADARGVIYGAYDISAKMGVSPWYWWADVPVVKKTDLYVTAGTHTDAPKVKYRGFFINDEEPAFGGWAREKFGGINHQLYGHVFELELRLKGNYLWPAMWGKAFWDDDPLNPQTAADYGIVMGTSHHEPMTRAQDEWHRHLESGVTGGKWDYTVNAANLRTFWRGGIERMQTGGFENVVTIGMRGDGDEPMSEGTATQLLENIVADQRKIIADVTGKPADRTPQVWALYKEVQDYYDHGMRVPDDVTLLFSDDNWGQIRRLPEPGKARPGGYGVYYHFDYVGGPRNYKWLNTNQIEKTWQQMDLAYESGADRLWIVNVGDIKPMEFPLSFFMEMAWNPEAMTPEALQAYPAKWAGQQFGKAHAAEIGEILTRYSQLAARRKPELLAPDTYHWENYDDATQNLAAFQSLLRDTTKVARYMDETARPAASQLFVWPVMALTNYQALYEAVGVNRAYAAYGDPRANSAGEHARRYFDNDAKLTRQYDVFTEGKWKHFADQTHIGYDNWQQPDTNRMPELKTVTPIAGSDFVVRIKGDPAIYSATSPATIAFDPHHWWLRTIEVIDRGDRPVNFRLVSAPDWLRFMGYGRDNYWTGGFGQYDIFAQAYGQPAFSEGDIVIRPDIGEDIRIHVTMRFDPAAPKQTGRLEQAGYVAIEAEHFDRKVDGDGVHWQVIPHLGRTLSSVISLPQTVPPSTDNDMRLEYDFALIADGDATLHVYLAPALDTQGKGGLRLAVAIDDGAPQTLTFDLKPDTPEWNQAVKDNIVILKAPFKGLKAGKHTIKVFRIDGNVVLERLVLDTGGLKPSYLGPPESARN